MTLLEEGVFLSEIVLQIRIAQRAADRLKATQNNFDQIETWSSIQSFLIASGNVSKIIWPRLKHKERGETLRKLLKVNEDNILRNRKFRNYFEHYDDEIQ